jgi:hypothetical protein
MTARFQMCKNNGYDAIEPDNIDDQLAYNEWIAGEAHSLGLAVFQKNDPEQASTLQPYFDGILDEQCNQYSECNLLSPYLSAGKPALDAEYASSTSFCSADNSAGIMGAIYNLNLDGGTYQPCW